MSGLTFACLPGHDDGQAVSTGNAIRNDNNLKTGKSSPQESCVMAIRAWSRRHVIKKEKVLRLQTMRPKLPQDAINPGNLGDEIIRLWIVSQHWRLDS